MKWIGFLLILLGSSGVGFSMVSEYGQRIEVLGNLKTMLGYISDMVLVECVPLAEAFRRCEFRMEDPYREFLHKVAEQMEEFCGENPSFIWKSNAGILKPLLKGKDYLSFCECMGQTGFMDVKGQSQALKNYEQSLEMLMKQLREQREDKCRLYQTLGIMAGVFVCILLL